MLHYKNVALSLSRTSQNMQHAAILLIQLYANTKWQQFQQVLWMNNKLQQQQLKQLQREKRHFMARKQLIKVSSAGSTGASEREPALISNSTFAPFIPLLPPLIEHYVRIIKP